ncbi:hypothetical protein AHAS_Ahas18G0160600 [Arachis hypogaea]
MYWNFGAVGMYLTRVTYEILSPENKDIADVLWSNFVEWPLNSRDVMGDPEMCRTYIVQMADGLTQLARLKDALVQEESGEAPPSTPQSRPQVDS